jgi:hypothetical protein
MKKVGVSAAMILGLAGAAFATDASADAMVTKAAPAAMKKASPPPAACSSLWDFIVTSCPLTWDGITVYGTIDAGVTWQSHGTPFHGTAAVGEEYLISKNSNRALWALAPNVLTQSNIGIKGNEPFALDGRLSSICRLGSIRIPCNSPTDRTRWLRTPACRSPAKTRMPTRAGPGNSTTQLTFWA